MCEEDKNDKCVCKINQQNNGRQQRQQQQSQKTDDNRKESHICIFVFFEAFVFGHTDDHYTFISLFFL